MSQAKLIQYGDESSSQEDNFQQNGDEVQTADEIDDGHGGAPANTASVFSASLNMFKSLVGIGILALPTAFSQSGYIAGVILLPLCAAGMLYLSHELMNVALKKNTNAKNLVQFTKETCTNKIHSIMVNICLMIFQTGACISYVIFFITYIQKTMCNLNEGNFACSSKLVAVLISLSILVPVMMIQNMSKLKFGSMVGNVVVLISLTTVLIYCFIYLGQDGLGNVEPFNISKMGGSIGVFIFSFEGVGVYFNVRNSMKQPTKFNSVLNYSISVAIALYILIGLIGYLTFGSGVNDIILFSFPDDNIPMQVVQFIYCISLILTYPVQIFPCVNVLEIKLRKKLYSKKSVKQIKQEEDNENIDQNQVNPDTSYNGLSSNNENEVSVQQEQEKIKLKRKYLIGSVLIRLSFISVTYLVGILFDNISDFLSLTGDVCGIYLCYLIPAFIIYSQEKNYPLYKKIINLLIVIIAIGFGIYGLYCTGIKIKEDFF
ncbi:hypothetical protein ABPG74_021646 [Tetrahymena malaccensis]